MNKPRSPSSAPRILLFDGICNVCSAWVDWVLRLDPDGKIQFASLQSEIGRELLEWAEQASEESFFTAEAPTSQTQLSGSESSSALDDRDDGNQFASMVFIEDGVAHARSTAVLRACRYLRFPFPLLAAALIIPRPIRDWLYAEIAAHRYEWFGKRSSCRVPTPEIAERFLESND